MLQAQVTATESHDLGGDYFDKRNISAARQRRLVARLEAMGHKVTLEPAARSTVQPMSALRAEGGYRPTPQRPTSLPTRPA